IARGTYYPTNDNDRNITFNIPPGVHIYGGFLGKEKKLEERDYALNITTLSGDIGTKNDRSDNSYSVLSINDVSSPIHINGLTVEEGLSDSPNQNESSLGKTKNGGGLFITTEDVKDTSAITIRNCVFFGNRAIRGGAIFTQAGKFQKLLLDNCTFIGNTAIAGGAIQVSDGQGRSTQEFTINHCTFRENFSDIGGGIYCEALYQGIDIKIKNSLFEENRAILGGGGRIDDFTNRGSIELSHCDFIKNEAINTAGGFYVVINRNEGNVIVNGCSFIENNCAFQVDDPSIEGVTGGLLIGSAADSVSNTFITNSKFINNTARYNGALGLTKQNLYMENCLFANNKTEIAGGAIDLGNSANPIEVQIHNTTFYQNHADQVGGAIFSQKNSRREQRQQIFIYNSIFEKNTAVKGSAVYSVASDFYFSHVSTDINSCDSLACNFNCSEPPSCENVLFSANALFQDALNNNFTLSPCSPAINAGNNDFVADLPTDLKDNPRIQDGRVDLGAYEAP
ncbi:MAG: choice-of-anchor Q domain-containing protein, partial [Bacteroidota bacterium]